MSPPLAFIIILFGSVVALACIIVAVMTFANRRYEVVTNRDKHTLMILILLAIIGLVLVVIGLTVPANAQTGPPSWGTKARVSTCPPYNPAACQYRTVWIEAKGCSMRIKWWSPGEGEQIVSARCER